MFQGLPLESSIEDRSVSRKIQEPLNSRFRRLKKSYFEYLNDVPIDGVLPENHYEGFNWDPLAYNVVVLVLSF